MSRRVRESAVPALPVAPRARSKAERGQAAVELAFVLPVVLVLILVLIEGGLVARDQVMVVHAAREAARVAAVDPSPEAAIDAAVQSSGLRPLEVTLTGREGTGSKVTATVRYRGQGRLPLVGDLSSRITVVGIATMRVETDP